jgi:hypothetical protein
MGTWFNYGGAIGLHRMSLNVPIRLTLPLPRRLNDACDLAGRYFCHAIADF